MTDWPAGPPLHVDTAPRVGVDGIDGSGDANSDFCATLLAMASHELRQPLQVIVGAHHVLARIVHGSAAQAQLARVEDATRQLADKAYGRTNLDAMTEEVGGALYNEQPEPETLEACCVRPEKSPENLAQFIAGNADTAVAYLEAHVRAASTAGDEHATAARRVADGALSAGSTLPRPGAGPSTRSPHRLPSGREVAAAWLLCVFIAVLAVGATSGLHSSEPPAATIANKTAIRWHMLAVCTPPLPCAEGGTAILEPR